MGNCVSKNKKVHNDENAVQSAPQQQNNEQQQQHYVSFDTFFNTSKNPVVCDYLFKSAFGKGAMSRVYKVENINSHDIFAAKVYDLLQLNKHRMKSEEPAINGVYNEMDIMMNVSHRYVLFLVEAIEDEPTQSLILIMPFANKGSVQDLLDDNKMTMQMKQICFHQMAIGLQYLHSLNVIHRDIKNENFLAVEDDFYQLSDFSVSQVLDSPDQMLDDTKGSPAFLSPEECSGESFKPKPADVWAYGVSLYLALYNKLPFKLGESDENSVANSVLVVTQKLEEEKLEFPENSDVDPFAEDLLERCLAKNPEDRITFDEIPQHPFFRDVAVFDEIRQQEMAAEPGEEEAKAEQ